MACAPIALGRGGGRAGAYQGGDGTVEATSRAEQGGARVLVTGASGYVGGRLLQALEARRNPLRCLARTPESLRARVAPDTQVFRGDAVTGEGLAEALRGVDTAYYLIHSMGAKAGFETADRSAARNFGAAAREAGVARVIYLGGLADESAELSPHLRSRIEVGRVLRESGVPVIELRASVVIGSGSLSFEMIRSLVERLPVLVTPRWVSMSAQPIGIEDLIAYLLEALEVDPRGNPIFEIGGADRMSYRDLMREYARQRGLRRAMIPVPLLTPWLSSLWLGLVTPLYARVGRKLIDSIRQPTVVRDDAARRAFRVVPSDIRSAIRRALDNEDRAFAQTRWSDALSAAGVASQTFGGVRVGARLIDSREIAVRASAEQAFAAVRRIGGETGWYAHDTLWRVRGWIDLLLGGVGMRRGRAHPDRLRIGDTVDCWRVVALEPNRRLGLSAEMRLPGRAWLEFEIAERGGVARIRQTAMFEPTGVAGRLYWYGIYPLHALVFGGMLRGIARAAVDRERANASGRGRAPSVIGVCLARGREVRGRDMREANALQGARLPSKAANGGGSAAAAGGRAPSRANAIGAPQLDGR
ncbi:MAG TPA: SDR family oxidoreductase [Myxococcota bacterium]|nr:SDR family oxidoreductase [Myxococcota bacterium]